MQPLAASPCADIFRACQLQLKVEGIYCLFNRKVALCAKTIVFRSSVSVELRPSGGASSAAGLANWTRRAAHQIYAASQALQIILSRSFRQYEV